MTNDLALTIASLRPDDANRGIARIDPVHLTALGGCSGALLAIDGPRTVFARALPSHASSRGKGLLHIDCATRRNARCAEGATVRVRLGGGARQATRICLQGTTLPEVTVLRRVLDGVPLYAGDRFRVTLVGGRETEVQVVTVEPEGCPVLLTAKTHMEVGHAASSGRLVHDGPRYEDLGGLGEVVARIREVVELPLRRPALFGHLGITPPKGVLLVGPPGTGKTLIARAVANECAAHFITINAPEIVDRFYGASEQHLRAAFDLARKKAPSIIFVDEIDAIAQKREALSGDKQVERRIVAQLLTLMDGLAGRGDVVVLAATNLPDGIDPALRRPGRFDREIRVDPPGRQGRQEILAIHTRAMPLAPSVDLAALAADTHGYVGADLAGLCRESAMTALRRITSTGLNDIEADLPALRIEMEDFKAAMREITPSALREVFVEVPNVRWTDVAGADGLRETLLRAVLLPMAQPERFARLGVRPPRGVLLHGRPGTGKTLMARALATEAQAGFIAVRGPELLSQWQGQSERSLREIFARARMASPCIIFFDEIDAIAGRRGSGDGATIERMVAQLLTEMDGLTEPGGIVVLAATNRPDRIDSALLRPGRFDLVLEITPPDRVAREAMLTLMSRKMPLSADVDVASLAGETEGFVGADLAGLCRLAALAALHRAGDAPDITAADFATAFREHTEGPAWRTM